MKTIPNARSAWKFWSMQLTALGTTVLSVLVLVPEAAVWAWQLMPVEWRDAVSREHMPLLSVIFFVGSAVARVLKQSGVGDD